MFIPPTIGFNALLSGLPSHATREAVLLSQQNAQAQAVLTERGAELMQRNQQIADYMLSRSISDIANQALRRYGGNSDHAGITELVSIADIQNANLITAKYISCVPEIASLIRQERLNGWADKIEPQYHARPLAHRMENMSLYQGQLHKGHIRQWSCSDDIQEIPFAERYAIFDAADAVKALLAGKCERDPTDRYNGYL